MPKAELLEELTYEQFRPLGHIPKAEVEKFLARHRDDIVTYEKTKYKGKEYVVRMWAFRVKHAL